MHPLAHGPMRPTALAPMDPHCIIRFHEWSKAQVASLSGQSLLQVQHLPTMPRPPASLFAAPPRRNRRRCTMCSAIVDGEGIHVCLHEVPDPAPGWRPLEESHTVWYTAHTPWWWQDQEGLIQQNDPDAFALELAWRLCRDFGRCILRSGIPFSNNIF